MRISRRKVRAIGRGLFVHTHSNGLPEPRCKGKQTNGSALFVCFGRKAPPQGKSHDRRTPYRKHHQGSAPSARPLHHLARQAIGLLTAEHLQDPPPPLDLHRYAAQNQRPAGL